MCIICLCPWILSLGCETVYGFRIAVQEAKQGAVRVMDTEEVKEDYSSPAENCDIELWSQDEDFPRGSAGPAPEPGFYFYGAHGTPFTLGEIVVHVRCEEEGYKPTTGTFQCSDANMSPEKTVLILMEPKGQENEASGSGDS